jgi:hypothetical protein
MNKKEREMKDWLNEYLELLEKHSTLIGKYQFLKDMEDNYKGKYSELLDDYYALSMKHIAYEKELLKEAEKTNNSTEWKELKINNLPSDILVGDYEFKYLSIPAGVCVEAYNLSNREIFRMIEYGTGIEYRLKPIQKTDEELAEEYVNIYAPNLPAEIYSMIQLKDREELRAHKKRAFIAGRQSKDGE